MINSGMMSARVFGFLALFLSFATRLGSGSELDAANKALIAQTRAKAAQLSAGLNL